MMVSLFVAWYLGPESNCLYNNLRLRQLITTATPLLLQDLDSNGII